MSTQDLATQAINQIGAGETPPSSSQNWQEAERLVRSIIENEGIYPSHKNALHTFADKLSTGNMDSAACTGILVILTRLALFPSSDPDEKCPEPSAVSALAELLRDAIQRVLGELDLYHRREEVETSQLAAISNHIEALFAPLKLLYIPGEYQLEKALQALPKSDSTQQRRETQMNIACTLQNVLSELEEAAITGRRSNASGSSQAENPTANVIGAKRTLANLLKLEAPDTPQSAFV